MKDLDLRQFVPGDLAALNAYDPPKGNCPVRLDANESPSSPPTDLEEMVRTALLTVEINRYPDPESRHLREAFGTRFGCSPELVMAGNGSDELIGFLVWTLRASRTGKRPCVVVPVPTFAMYTVAAKAAGYDVIEVPLGPGLEPDLEALLRVIRDREPSLVFLSNPNNPTGTFYTEEQVRELLEATKGLLVVDEAYGDYAGEGSWVSRVTPTGNLAVLRTLSKVGAAAIRCGFLAGGRDLLGVVNKVRFPFNVSRYTQAAGEVFLKNYDLLDPVIRTVVRERQDLAAGLGEAGLEVFPSRGNFLLVRCGGREKPLWHFLQEKGIMVKFMPRLPVAGDALRVTIGTPGENRLLVDAAARFVGEGGMHA